MKYIKENNINSNGVNFNCTRSGNKKYYRCNFSLSYEGEADFSKFKYEVK